MQAELLHLLRSEWRRGCNNEVVPGGMDALGREYTNEVPPVVAFVLRYYAILDIGQRKHAIILAGKLLQGKLLTEEERSWIQEVAMPPHIQGNLPQATWHNADARSLAKRRDAKGTWWYVDADDEPFTPGLPSRGWGFKKR